MIKTTFLVNKPGKSIIHLVHFTRTDNSALNLSYLQHRAKFIENLSVRWERFDRAHKRISQCHNCQSFGHTSSQCGRPRRCVKCLEDHDPQQCQRKSKDQEGTPKCVNCKGDHPANSPTCQHYISYREKITRTRANRQQIQQRVSQPQQNREIPLIQASPAPKFYSNVLRQSLNRNEPPTNPNSNPIAKLEQLSARFARIPNIRETIEKVESLVTMLESSPVDSHPQILLNFLGFHNA